jgi:tetratricopeptide (TPR) repeat protein
VQERRGKALQNLGKNEEALNAFIVALKTKTKCSICWTNLVMTYEAMEDRSKTAQWLRELSEFNINRTVVLTCQAEALAATRHFEEALMMFTEALKLRSDDVESLIGRGRIYSELKRYEEAQADFNKALILRPNYAEIILRRGQTYRCMKLFPEALKDFELVITLNSDFEHEGHEEKGRVLQSLQRYQAAINTFNQALRIEPTCLECWTELGRAYEALYIRSKVPKLMREVPISSGDKALAITHRAKVLIEMEFYQEALIDFDHAFSLDETIAFEANDDRGLVLSYLTRYPEAIECYKQSSKYNSNDYQALYNIAVAMIRWRGLSDAQKYIDAAREALLEKVFTIYRCSAFYGLGGLEALMGNTEQAFDYLQRAFSIDDEQIIEWMQRDMAWFDLRSDTRFQTLIFNGQQKTWNPATYYQIEREEQRQRNRDDTASLGSTNTLMSPETLPLHALKVFLCYSPLDRLVVQDLYRRLQANGIEPWLDEMDLLPGQEKETEIRKVVRASDAVIVCLSHNSTQKAGLTHKQINYALDVADEQPEGTIFLIPVKLEECNIPERLSRLHTVNLFDAQGYDRLIDALRTKFIKFNAT